MRRDSSNAWRTPDGALVVEEGPALGAFCDKLPGPDGDVLGRTFEYTVRDAEGAIVAEYHYTEGAEGWLAWATAYRVESDRLVRYTCRQEGREPWQVDVRVVLEGLAPTGS